MFLNVKERSYYDQTTHLIIERIIIIDVLTPSPYLTFNILNLKKIQYCLKLG